MNQSEVEELDDSVHEEIDPTVRELFDGIFEEPMRQFNERLEFIRENKFGAVWREENERNEKVMSFSKAFMQAVSASLPSIHAEAAKHIEGSTCDLFLIYVREKLYESPLGEELFEDSCSEIKDLMTRRILKIKEALEIKHDEQPKDKSDLEIMIQQTDLFDPIHIHHALLCCQIAYDCTDPEHINRTLEKLDKQHLLSELAVSYENENVPKYVMARCGDVLYVSFKGKQLHNFGSTEISYRGEICAGISQEAKKIPLKYFAREIIQDKRVVFSGHSSGGAIASLVFLFLLEKFKHQKESFLTSRFKCITFGLMPLAGSMFKKYVEAIPGAKDCFCHIVQKNDIVPKLFGAANMGRIHEQLWKLVEDILEVPLDILSANSDFPNATAPLQLFVEHGKDISGRYLPHFVGIHNLDIFGMYYIIDNSKQEQQYLILRAEQAAHHLRINECENVRQMQRQYLINHKIERYAHEVEIAFVKELPEIEKYKRSCNMEIANDIKPEITEVRFENIGEEVVAKIAGSSMWFVYNVSIEGVNGNGKDLQVDVMKSIEFEAQARMRENNLVHKNKVRVRVKTHFGNSKYLEAKDVPATTTTYRVSRRQQQLAKHSPSEVIELAYLSALLERRQEACYSKRFNAIKTFFKNAVSVVPLESLFFAMTKGKPEVMLQCCEIFTTGDAIPATIKPSKLLISGMKQAVERIRHYQSQVRDFHSMRYRFQGLTASRKEAASKELLVRELRNEARYARVLQIDKQTLSLRWNDLNQVLDDTIYRLVSFLKKYKKNGKKWNRHSVCCTNLEVIYPSTDVPNTRQHTFKCCKAPMTLLTEGCKEIQGISDKIIAEHSGSPAESVTSKTNSMMLTTLNGLRNEFQTCSTLLGAFMESQVQIPLKKDGGDTYVDKIAKHASSFGLSVWGLLILPFQYVNQMIGNLSEEFGQFVIEFKRHMHDFHDIMFPPLQHEFPDYDEKLEFLVGSMKQSWTCNQEYVSYSLERQLEDQCRKRKIFHDTPVDEILDQWRANFEDETLTLVPNEYRPLVARWIKWSLMINNLRESLASQIAIGVIGLVNSGKSKFVRSMFGKEAITGTTDHKRTTVPLIYNLNPEIKGMDVIDFPGVDDRDKSIPKLAELLLSLTRIVVFVVDYRRAHTESTRDWLSILAKENVPVLVCLTFADKLYAELMGKKEDSDAEKLKSGVEDQLKTIKEQIGQPVSGCKRDFKLTVFAFDNDSKLDSEEGKEKLRKAGLSDELDVGRWIAEKLEDYEQHDVSQNVLKFIREKEKSTLNSSRRTPTPVPLAEGQSGDASTNDEQDGDDDEASEDHRPSSPKSKN